VIDGDTIEVYLHFKGFDQYWFGSIRLLDVWAPEIRGKERDEGLVIKDKLIDYFESKETNDVILVVDGSDSFGRLVAEVFCGDESVNEIVTGWLDESGRE
jgi:endonuclease YncB( thermonuclease family)